MYKNARNRCNHANLRTSAQTRAIQESIPELHNGPKWNAETKIVTKLRKARKRTQSYRIPPRQVGQSIPYRGQD